MYRGGRSVLTENSGRVFRFFLKSVFVHWEPKLWLEIQEPIDRLPELMVRSSVWNRANRVAARVIYLESFKQEKRGRDKLGEETEEGD